MVEVVNGGRACAFDTPFLTSLTINGALITALYVSSASCALVGFYFLPVLSVKIILNFALSPRFTSADMVQYSCGTKD